MFAHNNCLTNFYAPKVVKLGNAPSIYMKYHGACMYKYILLSKTTWKESMVVLPFLISLIHNLATFCLQAQVQYYLYIKKLSSIPLWEDTLHTCGQVSHPLDKHQFDLSYFISLDCLSYLMVCIPDLLNNIPNKKSPMQILKWTLETI